MGKYWGNKGVLAIYAAKAMCSGREFACTIADGEHAPCASWLIGIALQISFRKEHANFSPIRLLAMPNGSETQWNGKVVCFGKNDEGQLGLDHDDDGLFYPDPNETYRTRQSWILQLELWVMGGRGVGAHKDL